MKNPIAFVCVVFLAFLTFFFFEKKEQETSQEKIERIVLAAYSPVDNEPKDRNIALSENVREESHFDKGGNLVWQRVFSAIDGSDFSLQSRTITRDENERPTEVLVVNDRDGKQKSRSVYSYPELSKDAVVEHFDEYDRLSHTEIERYDSRGRLISSEVTYVASGETEKTSFEYGLGDLPEKEIHYKADGSIDWMWKFRYDELNNLVERMTELYRRSHDPEVHVLVLEYDDEGNVFLETWLDEGGEVVEESFFEYVYDNYGNWVTKKRYSSESSSVIETPGFNNLEYVWERQIEYYGGIASAMREAGCIFLEDTLKICPNESLEYLNQYSNKHVSAGVIIPAVDSEYMRNRVFGVGVEVVYDRFCLIGCLRRQTSFLIEDYLSVRTTLRLLSSEEVLMGQYKGNLILFGSNVSGPNQRAEIEATFLTRINGRFVSFSTLYIFNTGETRAVEVIEDLKKVLELTLGSVVRL